MYDFLSPSFKSMGAFNSAHSLLFLNQEPSANYFNKWELLQPKIDVIEFPGVRDIIDFEGKSRRRILQELQLLPKREILEFVHWASIDTHEYIHAFDFFSSEFGYQFIYNKILIQANYFYKMIAAIYGSKIKIPLGDNNNPHIQHFIDEYEKSQKPMNLLLGNQIEVGKIVGYSPINFIVGFIPKGFTNFETPIPGIDLSKLGLGDEIVPLTTRHILESRAILAQIADIKNTFGPNFANDYLKEIFDKSKNNKDYLDYTLALFVISSMLHYVDKSDHAFFFEILDLSLQVRPSTDKHLMEVYPPILLLNILTELVVEGKNKKEYNVDNLLDFLRNDSRQAPNRNEFLKFRYEKLKENSKLYRVVKETVPYNRMAFDFASLRLKFLEFRLANEKDSLSPSILAKRLKTGGLPELPLVIKRSSKFNELTLYLSQDETFNIWFLHQSIINDLLYSNEVTCPYKTFDVNCPYKFANCGNHENTYRRGNEVCLFAQELSRLGLLYNINS